MALPIASRFKCRWRIVMRRLRSIRSKERPWLEPATAQPRATTWAGNLHGSRCAVLELAPKMTATLAARLRQCEPLHRRSRPTWRRSGDCCVDQPDDVPPRTKRPQSSREGQLFRVRQTGPYARVMPSFGASRTGARGPPECGWDGNFRHRQSMWTILSDESNSKMTVHSLPGDDCSSITDASRFLLSDCVQSDRSGSSALLLPVRTRWMQALPSYGRSGAFRAAPRLYP